MGVLGNSEVDSEVQPVELEVGLIVSSCLADLIGWGREERLEVSFYSRSSNYRLLHFLTHDLDFQPLSSRPVGVFFLPLHLKDGS